MMTRDTTLKAEWHVVRKGERFQPIITITSDGEPPMPFRFKSEATYAEARRAAKHYARPLRPQAS